MSQQKVILVGASLLLVTGLTVAKLIQAQNTQNNSVETLAPRNQTEAQLISIAEAALRAENDILVNGDQIAALKRNPRALKAQTAFQKRFKKARSRRTAMAAQKIAYKNFQMKFRVNKIQVNRSTATLEAIEGASLAMFVDSKLTEHNYSYSQQHLFTFVLENGQWLLSSDKRLNNKEEEAADLSTNSLGNNS